MYVRDREWVGASRWSWEETVRFTGVGKKGIGVEAVVEPEVDEAAGADSVGSPTVSPAFADIADGGRVVGAVIPKVSPAPSQSELVRSGVWI